MAMVSFEADNSSCAFFFPDDEEQGAVYGVRVQVVDGNENSLAADFAARWQDELDCLNPGGNFTTDDEKRVIIAVLAMVRPEWTKKHLTDDGEKTDRRKRAETGLTLPGWYNNP